MNIIKLKQELTENEMQIFESEYNKAKRSMLITYLFLPFLGLGAPFFYLGMRAWGCGFLATGISAVALSVIFKVDPEVYNGLFLLLFIVMSFTLPRHVSKRNAEIELQILKAIKGDGKVDRMWSVA